MIQEDRELLAELKHVTTHVTDFIIAILGATPVNPDSQRDLAEHLVTTGQLLLDHTNAGHIINGYLNGCVIPTPGELPAQPVPVEPGMPRQALPTPGVRTGTH